MKKGMCKVFSVIEATTLGFSSTTGEFCHKVVFPPWIKKTQVSKIVDIHMVWSRFSFLFPHIKQSEWEKMGFFFQRSTQQTMEDLSKW